MRKQCEYASFACNNFQELTLKANLLKRETSSFELSLLYTKC